METSLAPLTPYRSPEVYERYSSWVRLIATRSKRALPGSMSHDDLLSAAWVGMIEALQRRTSAMSDDHFEAFAFQRVRGAIYDEVRRNDPLGRRGRQMHRRIANAAASVERRLGRRPADDEVAKQMGVTLSDFHELRSRVDRRQVVQLHSDSPAPVAHEGSPESMVIDKQLNERLNDALQQLPGRLNQVLQSCYHDERSARDVGAELGISESRVNQLRARAIDILRKKEIDAVTVRPPKGISPHEAVTLRPPTL